MTRKEQVIQEAKRIADLIKLRPAYKHTLHIDIETRSSADIKTAGAYKYAMDEDFGILLIAYAIDDEPAEEI